MATSREIDRTETPLDPDDTKVQPPLSRTVDDDDDADDERWDENEPPDKEIRDRGETPDELPQEEIEEDPDDDDLTAEDE